MRAAVFLDRDGTMIHEANYLNRLEALRWFPWTTEAIRLLNRAGMLVCVTTNQGGIGLGFFTDAFVAELHAQMTATIEAAGAHVDGWFYCPHHPSATTEALRVTCDCRKPRTGMIAQAVERFGIDPARSYVVGDKHTDLEFARNAGARGVLVRTGYGEEVVRAYDGAVPDASCVAADLMAAVAWILADHRPPATPV
jgi:histidinol-phosphate phosphatase family protein